MNLHHVLALALVVFVLAGCSNKAAQLTAPSTEQSRLFPGAPPLEQANYPRIRVWTDDGWRVLQKVGGISFAPETAYHLELSAPQALTLHWSAQPAGQVTAYRWSVDQEDITDETPRVDEETDLARWSTWSKTTSTTLPPLAPGQHWVYIEARTLVGFISLFRLQLNILSESDPAITQAR